MEEDGEPVGKDKGGTPMTGEERGWVNREDRGGRRRELCGQGDENGGICLGSEGEIEIDASPVYRARGALGAERAGGKFENGDKRRGRRGIVVLIHGKG